MSKKPASKYPMFDLFCMEAKNQLSVLTDGLIHLKRSPADKHEIESQLRAIKSLKGAAKVSSLNEVFELARLAENSYTMALQDKLQLDSTVLNCIDEINQLFVSLTSIKPEGVQAWLLDNKNQFDEFRKCLTITEAASKSTGGNADKNPEKASLADMSMLDLFRMEAETQTQTLNNGLLELENNPSEMEIIEKLMRAAHSLKGAARMVGLDRAVSLSHLMEDVFVKSQNNELSFGPDDIDIFLASVDILAKMAKATADDFDGWLAQHSKKLEEITNALSAVLNGQPHQKPTSEPAKTAEKEHGQGASPGHNKNSPPPTEPVSLTIHNGKNTESKISDNVVRVSADSLNRLQGLSGEALVETRWLTPFSDSLLQVKRRQDELVSMLDRLREKFFDIKVDDTLNELMHNIHHKANECRDKLSARLTELESFDRRSNSLSHRLNREVLQARMRPFSDGVQGFQRLVRDVSRSLDKKVKLEIRGLATQVDRDILEKLQAPLNHMLRNAIDHGIESPEERLAMGKPEHGTIRLEAMHNAGMLSIIVQDDGCGIDLQNLRNRIVAKGMVNQQMAANLSELELLDFMFLPNFSTRDSVTEISGRGVGLDVVHSVVQELRGQIRSFSEFGKGTRFQFQLPLTLSVIRALLVEIDGEPYAFPLARIDQTIKIYKESIETMEGRQYFTFGNRHIGLLTAHQLLELDSTSEHDGEIPIVILGDRINSYGLVVDKFLSERNLVVHTLDPRLGKVQNINAGSLTECGDPLLIFDVDDVLRSIDLLLSGGRLNQVGKEKQDGKNATTTCKRILVVDDSITVREVERNLLQNKGYQVEVAVDGMDGWNAARTGHYDLIVSDIDMPRMNGFELVDLLKKDERFRDVPVIIVSYKDREEDRQRGMEVGADYYLTKGSFHDDTLVEAVVELIGNP